MTHKTRLRDHVRELAASHGLWSDVIRRLIGAGLLPDIDMQPGPHHKQPDETVPAFAARLLVEGGPLITEEDFARARRLMCDALSVTRVVLPKERFAEAVAFLRGKGVAPTAKALFELIGGDLRQLATSLKALRGEPIAPEWRLVMEALDCEIHHLDALVRQGFVEELREGSDVFGGKVLTERLRTEILQSFRMWAPTQVDFQTIKDVAVIRSGLRMGALDNHSPGLIDGGVDLLKSKGQKPTRVALEGVFGGNPEQFDNHLRRRARERGDVPLPPRYMKGLPDLEDLRMAVAPELAELYDTALDRRRGSARDLPTRAQIGRVIHNPHAGLQVVAAVVSLHGARIKAFSHKVAAASRGLAGLGEPLLGTDISNAAQLAAAMTAVRLLVGARGDRHEIQRLNEDINSWRFAMEIFDHYLARKDLPCELATFLAAYRPAFPSGGDDLFKAVRQAIDDFNEESKSVRDGALQPYLADLPRFLNRVLEAQSDFEEFRDYVRAAVKEAEDQGGIDQGGLDGRFETDARLPDGTVARVVYHFRILLWSSVMVSIAKMKRGWKRHRRVIDVRTKDPFNQHPGSERLFENCYVVEMLGCTRDGITIEYPLDIIRFHRDFGFWRPKSCPDEQAFDKRCAALVEFGLSSTAIDVTGHEIANFEKNKFRRVRAMRTLHGVFLLPLEEIHHSCLIGALHVASRAVDALRVGELTQWNVGTGLETGWDASGKPFAILSSIPKKKVEPRKTPLSEVCETLTEKLLAVASERFFQDSGIPPMRRWKYNGKGPEVERLIFCGRSKGLSPSEINHNSRLLMCGNDGFKSHYMKYIWSALSRRAGQSLAERRDGHGHSRTEMTAEYDVLTPDETAEDLRLRHEQATLRASWMRGERDSPLPDPPLQALRFERRRLANDIEFLEDNGAEAELKAALAKLSVLEAKIRRAESTV